MQLALLLLTVLGSAIAASPPADTADADTRRLIEQLGDRDYFLRERAEAQLLRRGIEAFDILSEATANEDLEIAARAKRILQGMRVDWAEKTAPQNVQALMRDYEFQNAASRQAKMRALVLLPNDVGVPTLCRLVRFEKMGLLSKVAALELIGSQKGATAPKKRFSDLVLKNLDDSHRTAAQWLRTWLRFFETADANDEWTRLIDAEEKVLRDSPSQSTPEVIAALLRFQVARLKKLGRSEEAVAAIRRLIQLEKGDPETLASLMQWLVEQKAWKAIDELAERFAPQFASNSVLLYRLAEAQLAQGRAEDAEATAKRAFLLNPGRQPQELIGHYVVASGLRQLGRFAWARREYEHILSVGPAGGDMALNAAFALSEMLHDQAQELDAAEVLKKVSVALGEKRPAKTQAGGRTLGELRSRMDYFYARHWQDKGDAAKQREYLDKALIEDPSDIDVLIACYRLPNTEPAFKKKIVESIKSTADDLREKISDEPDDAINYNQFAWLIGNTEGDMDEALKFSQKSLELAPETGGYYDTLGRVYFGKGDLENAVKSQAKAAELDPHSGQVLKQLELFRSKLEEKQKSEKEKPAAKPAS